MNKVLTILFQATIIFLGEVFTGLYRFVLCIRKKPKNINGQLALVTGGARGLGKAIAERLAQEGCNLAICDVHLDEAQRTCEELQKKYKISCEAFKADVSDTQQVDSLHKEITEKMGVVDILVNNAGILAPLGILEGEDADVSRVINVNLTSHFWMVRKFLPAMIEQKRGHILGISSSAAKYTPPFSVAYCASKFGSSGFYRSMFTDLCMYDYHKFIKITTAYPGFINTRNDLEEFMDIASELTPRMSPKYAAKQIVNAMLMNKQEIFFPFVYRVAAYLEEVLPPKTVYYVRRVLSSNGTDLKEQRISMARK
ncbi:estradiol 17-beta-dehydrogenase 11-like [Chironomus tepperi]|uniref:estradiol 17-beta-dehydrogenase 11-like n=1 Tax=Chironomus tepperi TaxID=113505 RepID=UPI00391F3071